MPLSCLASADGEVVQGPDVTGTGTEAGADSQVQADSEAGDPAATEPEIDDHTQTEDQTDQVSPETEATSRTGTTSQCLREAGTPGWSPGPGAPMGCTIPGIGIIPAQALQALLQRFDIRISRMLVDAETGVTRETSSTTYRPPARLRQHVQARDGTCRFPGCRVAATRCQLDHVDPWPLGRTAPDNLICLCTHHHRLKTHTRWQPNLHPDGTVTWTDPFGQTYLTHPVDHLQTYVA